MTRGARQGWSGRGDLAASLTVIMPLVLAYGLGVLATGSLSVIDVPTRLLWRAVDRDRALYLLVHAGLGAAYLLWIARRGRRGLLSAQVLAPLLVEAAVWALALMVVLDVIAGGAWLLARLGLPRPLAWWVALAGSSALFALAHHWAGEPWTTAAFTARAVAGVGFALLAWYRSLAHAVYTHALYDLLLVGLRA